MSYELCEKIRDLEPYEPISGNYKIRLDANESFVMLSDETQQDMLGRMSKVLLNRYPDPLASEICELFARYHGIGEEFVTAGNGSDELLSIITQAFLMRSEHMTVLSPDFSMYGFYGSIAEANTFVFRKNADGTFCVDDVIKFVNENGSRLLIFSNPCNPTGAGICASEVMRLVDGCPDCLVVVDEAYMDFWDQSVITLAPHRANMMVLRTCSKAFRMAGIRIGFAVANSTLTAALRAVKSPYNINSLSQAAAAAMLSRPDEIREATQTVLRERDKLYAAVKALQENNPEAFELAETVTNFFVIKMPSGCAREMFEKLKSAGIVVRLMGDNLRITVGSEQENKEFLMAFQSNL